MDAFGGLHITGGADTLALTTTAARMISWSASGGSNSDADSNTDDGNASIVPDYANNRIKVMPGVYKVDLVITGDMDTAADVIAQIYKNSVAVSKLKQKQRMTTNKDQIVISGLLEVLESDIPDTLPTFADPSATGFAGAGAAPKSLVPIDVYLSLVSGSQTITFEEAAFTLIKVK